MTIGALRGDAPAASSLAIPADRRELAIIAVERTRMPMIVTDPRQDGHPIVLANQAFLDLMGQDADGIIGRNPRFMQGPETDQDAIAQIRAAIQEERDITIELHNYRKDGSSFWNQLYLSPVHDQGAKLIYFFGSTLDVTKRRKAQKMEETQRRLLLEVDHRANNALAIVQGIVRLTPADDPRGYARAVQGRIDMLARAHALLAKSNWQDLSLGTIIDVLANRSERPFITAAGPEVMLAAAKVQSFALLLHELFSNALQHGSLSAGGSVAIAWERSNDNAIVDLHWLESGKPCRSPDRSSGLGLTLISHMAKRQLAGNADFNFHPDGLNVYLSMKVS